MAEQTEENKKAAAEVGPGYREFCGRKTFRSNMLQGVLANAVWIGAMHFNVLLLLLSLLFLPFSKFLL